MKVVTVNLRDIENRTHGSIGAGTSATVTMRYTGPVVLTSFGHIIPVTPKSKAVPSDGIVEFAVYTSDDPAVEPNYRGFAHRITVDVTDSRTGRQVGRWTSTVKVMEAHKEPVRAGLLPPAEGLPAKWVTVGELVSDMDDAVDAAKKAVSTADGAKSQAGQAVATVDNLSATATALPPGATPTVTVTGPIPNKVINIGVPKGDPGMGYEEGQQLLTQNAAALSAAQAAATSAASSASDADQAVALAQQAQAAALEVPDSNVSALVSNPATDTRAALAKVLPSKRVEVASMPAWTGDENDDQSAAFAQAAAVYAGPMVIGVPVGTWKAQGMILREGLYYVGQGLESTTLIFPDTPTDHMFRSTAHGTIWSGGVLSMTINGGGGLQGVGHPGYNGIDLYSYDQVHAFEIRDMLIRGFQRGVNGSQNGGIGDDRWLTIVNTRVWRCHVGIYANEHPQLFGVDVRECHFGITGRLYDFGMSGGKINRNIVGIGGSAGARCSNTNCSVSSVSFYRNETALIVGSHAKIEGNWIKGGHPLGTRPGGVTVRGIVCDGQFINVTGNRFGTGAFQCDVDVDIITAAASTNRLVDITANFFIGGGGSHPAEHIGCIRSVNGGASVNIRSNTFYLINSGRGIHLTGGITGWNITDNQCWITGDGQFVESTNGLTLCSIERNTFHANAGITLSRSLIKFGVTSSNVNWYRYNILRTVSGTIGNLYEVDSRNAHMDGNVVGPNCTIANTWVNVGGVGTLQYLGANNGPELRAVSNSTRAIPNGQSSITVPHGLPKAPTTVVATPFADARVWVTDRNATHFTLNREGTSGSLSVGWIAYAFNNAPSA